MLQPMTLDLFVSAPVADYPAALALELDQIDPTHLDTHGAAELVAHPLRDRAAHPLGALGSWSANRFGQFRQALHAEEGLRAMRMGVLPVAHAICATDDKQREASPPPAACWNRDG